MGVGRRELDTARELNWISPLLAQYRSRTVLSVPDVEQWLAAHPRRRVEALILVWDRGDARVLRYARPDLEVATAVSLLGWARQRYRDTARDLTEIPEQRPPPESGQTP